MRIGIATITSTALVGGTLVAVPAHPLLPVTAVAQAQEAVASQPLTAADIATAEALGIDLGLLNLNVLDAIEAEDAWPNRSGAEDNALTLDALQALRLDLGGSLNNLPLVKTEGEGLLDLGGNGVGILGAAADAPGTTGITASAGVLAEEGSIALDPSLNQGTGPAKIDVLALTDQLGLDPVVSALIQELNLEIGAIGSEIEKNGDTITTDYTVADLDLVLESTAVSDLAGVLNGVGATLDTTLGGVLGDAGVVNSITNGLGPLTETLGLGTPQVTLTTNLEGTVQDLIGGVIYDGQSTGGAIEDALVELNLNDGTVRVNLENLHAEGLNDRPANTELTTAELTLITDTVNGLVQELLDRVRAALQGGLSDTEVFVSIGVDTSDGSNSGILGLLRDALGTDNNGLLAFLGNAVSSIFELLGLLLGGLVGGIQIESTLGGLLGTPGHDPATIESTGTGLILEILAPLLDGILNDVVAPLGASLQGLLTDEVNGILDDVLAAGPANELLNSLSPLLDSVLSEVLLITLNKQDEVEVAGQPGLRVTALDVQLLPNVTGAPVTHLALSTSQVAGPSQADLDNYAPTITVVPDEGPFGEPETVTIAGNNLVYVGTDGVPVSLVTNLAFGAETVSAEDITPNVDGSLTVEVPVVEANEGENERPVTVTLTTGGGEDTDTFTYRADDEETPVPDSEADIYEVVYTGVEVEAGETATSSPVFTQDDVAAGLPEGASFDLGAGAPEWATIDEVTGVVTVAPGVDVDTENFNIPVVVTYSDDSTDTPSVAVNVTAADDEETPVPDPAPSLDGNPIPVDPTDESQDTGLNLNDGDENDVVAKDESGNNLVVEVDADGNISVIPGDILGPITIIVNEDDADNRDEREVPVNTVPGVTPPANGSVNGSTDFLQQCMNSPAAGVASLLVVLGAVGAVAGPALEPMFKSIGGELDRQLRMMVDATAGAHQPQWVRNINKGLNDAANSVDHQMVTNGLFATAAIALASSPILCGMDNSSSGSSESN